MNSSTFISRCQIITRRPAGHPQVACLYRQKTHIEHIGNPSGCIYDRGFISRGLVRCPQCGTRFNGVSTSWLVQTLYWHPIFIIETHLSSGIILLKGWMTNVRDAFQWNKCDAMIIKYAHNTCHVILCYVVCCVILCYIMYCAIESSTPSRQNTQSSGQSRPRFKINTFFWRMWIPRIKDKDDTATRPSYFWHGNLYTGKTAFLYWNTPKSWPRSRLYTCTYPRVSTKQI